MHYRVIVLRGTNDGEELSMIVDRPFTFYESSHKVEDIFNLAVEQAEREGGDM